MALFSRTRRAPRGETVSQGMLSGRHILIVDDDDEVRRLLKTVLELEGARVSDADRVAKALEIASRGPCDAVITDITMGHTRRDGIRLLRELRADPDLAAMPVLALTGCTRLQSELVAHGFDRVLIKPIDVLTVAPMLRALLDFDSRLAA
jgi:CheY-like chemotaxis protein